MTVKILGRWTARFVVINICLETIILSYSMKDELLYTIAIVADTSSGDSDGDTDSYGFY